MAGSKARSWQKSRFFPPDAEVSSDEDKELDDTEVQAHLKKWSRTKLDSDTWEWPSEQIKVIVHNDRMNDKFNEIICELRDPGILEFYDAMDEALDRKYHRKRNYRNRRINPIDFFNGLDCVIPVATVVRNRPIAYYRGRIISEGVLPGEIVKVSLTDKATLVLHDIHHVYFLEKIFATLPPRCVKVRLSGLEGYEKSTLLYDIIRNRIDWNEVTVHIDKRTGDIQEGTLYRASTSGQNPRRSINDDILDLLRPQQVEARVVVAE